MKTIPCSEKEGSYSNLKSYMIAHMHCFCLYPSKIKPSMHSCLESHVLDENGVARKRIVAGNAKGKLVEKIYTSTGAHPILFQDKH